MNLMELQGKINKSKLDALLVVKGNCFIGQDILDDENEVFNLTGFSGSKGMLLVFSDKAYLFVDGRYDIQARKEVDLSKVEVIVGKRADFNAFVKEKVKEKKKLRIGFNPWCHTIKEVIDFREFSESLGPKLLFEKSDLCEMKLNKKEPLVFEHTLEFSGQPRVEKIGMIAEYAKDIGADAFFVSAADSVSWLLNVRSDLLKDTPIVRAMALVDASGEVKVFCDNIDYKLKFEEKVSLFSLSDIDAELAKYKKKTVAMCFYATPQKIADVFEKNRIEYFSNIDPCQKAKAQKNPAELQGMKDAHLRDGVSVVKFLYWLENNYEGQSEMDVVDVLYDLRKNNDNFFSNSFETIAGFGEHGAIVHYCSNHKTNKKLSKGGVLLLDSGAQYLDGTTDITRTIAIGDDIDYEIKESYTQVLKAHIALADTVFVCKTSGLKLDIIARKELWRCGKDYNHGTGHGVGHFMNVHEGPISISSNGTQYGFAENMVTSIEPGYYKEGEYGIRLENLYYTEMLETGNFRFVSLTLAPFDKKLIVKELLNGDEIKWINEYHDRVFASLVKSLEDNEKDWLKDQCSKL